MTEQILINKNSIHSPYPISFSTVDIICLDLEREKILLGKKPHKDTWCFPGGFTDPSSNSDEEDAARELYEECNIEISPNKMKYIGNFKIDDDRYRNTIHGIRTHLFYCVNDSEKFPGKAGDDLEEIVWIDYSDILNGKKTIYDQFNGRYIANNHRPLMEKIVEILKLNYSEAYF